MSNNEPITQALAPHVGYDLDTSTMLSQRVVATYLLDILMSCKFFLLTLIPILFDESTDTHLQCQYCWQIPAGHTDSDTSSYYKVSLD